MEKDRTEREQREGELMELITKKAAVTDESAVVPDEGLIAALSPSHATHLLLSAFVCEREGEKKMKDRNREKVCEYE